MDDTGLSADLILVNKLLKKCTMKKIRFYLTVIIVLFSAGIAGAHCDSYDGPLIRDALKALNDNNVSLVLKWISPSQEEEITSLFNTTYNLKDGNKEVYAIVEKHFLETLVRLHRQTEGAPFDGLKAAGTTKPITVMSDEAINSGDGEELITALTNHISKVVREKYNAVAVLEKTKNNSPEEGRRYVKAYIDYTHTVEGLHDIIEMKHEH